MTRETLGRQFPKEWTVDLSLGPGETLSESDKALVAKLYPRTQWTTHAQLPAGESLAGSRVRRRTEQKLNGLAPPTIVNPRAPLVMIGAAYHPELFGCGQRLVQRHSKARGHDAVLLGDSDKDRAIE